jgi:exodeoxyribonuclease-3
VKIATFNVNSVRARMPILLEWLDEVQPDLVALQETKAADDVFPMADLEMAGWFASIHGQKRYNGVAMISKKPLEDVEVGFSDGWPEDCRVIQATLDGVRFINTYVPNGTEVGSEKWDYKMRWMDEFGSFVSSRYKPTDKVIWLGDINVAPTPDDVFESAKHLGGVGHHPDEFEKLSRLVDWGWTDCFRNFDGNQGPGHYTFWDFRIRGSVSRNLGWRIDHIYATEPLVGQVERCWVDRDPRTLERPSDHTPLLATL